MQRKANETVPLARRPAPVIQRATKAGHQPFHDKLLEDVNEKAFDFGGGRTVFHKISQSYLKHFTTELDIATGSADVGVKAAATRFVEALKTARHKNIGSTGAFVMLNNLPMNLEIGPPAEDVRKDQGSLFDGNTKAVAVAAAGGPPRLERRLTPRSAELKKISDLIQDHVLKGQHLTEGQWDAATAALTTGQAAHVALTGGHSVMTDPLAGQWVKADKGLWDKHKTADMEREYTEVGAKPLEEAASYRRALEKELEKQRKAEIKAQEERAALLLSKYLTLNKKVDNILRKSKLARAKAEEVLGGVVAKSVLFAGRDRVTKIDDDIKGLIGPAYKSREKKKKIQNPIAEPETKLRALVIEINALFA